MWNKIKYLHKNKGHNKFNSFNIIKLKLLIMAAANFFYVEYSMTWNYHKNTRNETEKKTMLIGWIRVVGLWKFGQMRGFKII